MVAEGEDINGEAFKKFYNLPEDIKFIDTDQFKSDIKNRWPESHTDSHERAMMVSQYQAKKMAQFKRDGLITKDKNVCYLLVSHGMLVKQQGHMLEIQEDSKKANGSDEKFFPTPLQPEAKNGEDKEMIKSVEHIDWQGPPVVDLCAFNSFSVGVGADGEFEDVRVLDIHCNGIHRELKDRSV